MPFVSEELWSKLAEFGAARDSMLISAKWPVFPDAWVDAEAEAEIGWVIELVSEVRSIRSEMNVPPSARADDLTFLRRAHLDTIGVLPTVEEARAFLADKSKEIEKWGDDKEIYEELGLEWVK